MTFQYHKLLYFNKYKSTALLFLNNLTQKVKLHVDILIKSKLLFNDKSIFIDVTRSACCSAKYRVCDLIWRFITSVLHNV